VLYLLDVINVTLLICLDVVPAAVLVSHEEHPTSDIHELLETYFFW